MGLGQQYFELMKTKKTAFAFAQMFPFCYKVFSSHRNLSHRKAVITCVEDLCNTAEISWAVPGNLRAVTFPEPDSPCPGRAAGIQVSHFPASSPVITLLGLLISLSSASCLCAGGSSAPSLRWTHHGDCFFLSSPSHESPLCFLQNL